MKFYLMIAGAALVGVGIWWKIQNTNEALAKWLLEKGATSSDVSPFENGFLKAWKAAVNSGDSGFYYKESYYNAKGGKKIK